MLKHMFSNGKFKQPILIASNNQAKIDELISILANFDLVAEPYFNHIAKQVFPTEQNYSYLANALTKAEFIYALVQQPVLADDSGLELALDPNLLGLNTARVLQGFNEQQKLDYILQLYQPQQADTNNSLDRTAKLISSMVLQLNPNIKLQATGVCTGSIATQVIGNNGYEFDKIFIADVTGVTLASSTKNTSNQISHKAKAITNLYQQLIQLRDNEYA